MKKELVEGVDYSVSCGNIFADLGLPDAEEELLKAQLGYQIRELIKANGWTQAQVAEMAGITQPKVSNIIRARMSGYSVERLLHILNRLGYSIEVRIAKRRRQTSEARTTVTMA